MNSDRFEQKIYDYFKNSNIPRDITDAIYNVNLENNRLTNIYIVKKVIIALISILTISTGLVFSKDVERIAKKIFANSSQAIDIAVENEYVQTTEMKYVYDKNIGIKADNIVLDDLSLAVSFRYETNIENVKSMKIQEYCLLTGIGKPVHNSDAKYEEIPVASTASWSDSSIKISDKSFTDSVLYTLRQSEATFDKLVFDIKTIRVIHEDDTIEDVQGEWKFSVEILDEMKHSNSVGYNLFKQNEYIERCKGFLSPTGLLVEIELKEQFNVMKYFDENIGKEEVNGVGIFYLKRNMELFGPSSIDQQGMNSPKFKMQYNNVSIFSSDINEFVLYLEPFDCDIILIKEER